MSDLAKFRSWVTNTQTTMKQLHSRAFLCAFLLVCFGTGTRAQWSQLNGPYAGTVNFVTIFKENLYVGSYNFLNAYVYRSTDNGASWSDFNGGVKGIAPNTTASLGNDLYVGSAGKDIYRSVGGAGNWQVLDSGIAGKTGLNYLTALPTTLVLVGGNLSTYVLNLATDRWVQMDTGVAGVKSVSSITHHGDMLFVSTTGKGVLTSNDSGAHWTQANTGLFSTNISACFVQGDEIFAKVGFADSLYVSMDDGAHWTFRGVAPKGTNQNIVTDGVHLYSFRQNLGISRSDDSGRSWQPTGGGVASLAVQSLSATPTLLAIGTIAGLFVSTDRGQTCTQAVIASAHFFTNIQSLAAVDGVLFAGTSSSGVYRSFDRGIHFAAADLGFSFSGVAALTAMGSDMYCGNGGAVYHTTDNGSSWSRTDTLSSNRPATVPAMMAIGNTLYAASNGIGVFTSTDNGFSWTMLDTVGIRGKNFTCMDIVGDTIMLGTSSGIYVKTDADQPWAKRNDGITDLNIQALAHYQGAHFAGTPSGVFRSLSVMTSYSPVLQFIGIKALAVVEDTIFAGGDGISVSTDGGTSWLPDGDNVSSMTVSSFGTDGLFLYAGTTVTGVWRRAISPFASTPKELPASSMGLMVYPNPARTDVTIHFRLAEAGEIDYIVRDALGKWVLGGSLGYRELGEQVASLPIRSLPSGIYTCELHTTGSTERVQIVIAQ